MFNITSRSVLNYVCKDVNCDIVLLIVVKIGSDPKRSSVVMQNDDVRCDELVLQEEGHSECCWPLRKKIQIFCSSLLFLIRPSGHDYLCSCVRLPSIKSALSFSPSLLSFYPSLPLPLLSHSSSLADMILCFSSSSVLQAHSSIISSQADG